MYEHIIGAFNYDLTPILIENIPWKTVTWGKTNRPLPRQVQSMHVHTLLDLVPNLIEVVSTIQEKYGNISSVWMNLYRDGSDHCPYHRDSYDCTVVTVSFGSNRTFKIKDKLSRETSFTLSNGDIFMFDKAFNDTHQHSIAKTTARTGTRVSLVFFCQ